MSFQRAEKKKLKLRFALMGISGSGKTYSALRLATGLAGKLGKRIAMIDTEYHSGELYSDSFDYDICCLGEPFSPEAYVKLIKEAEAQKDYGVLIIDSLSHAWAGTGGILDIVDKLQSTTKSANSFTAWRWATPQHNSLINTILASQLHIIVTLRSKTAYELMEENGKKRPVKIGLAPIQREGTEYEFTCVADINLGNNLATVVKNRTSLFKDGLPFLVTEKTGEELFDWLNTGKESETVLSSPTKDPQNFYQQYPSLRKPQVSRLKEISEICGKMGLGSKEQIISYLNSLIAEMQLGNPINDGKELSSNVVDILIERLKSDLAAIQEIAMQEMAGS